MFHPILVASAAGGRQASTGRAVGETPTVREMIALDHLSHLWQTFRKGEERYQTTNVIQIVTGRNLQRPEEFFRENAGFVAGSTQEA
jgi:hypothetical protein